VVARRSPAVAEPLGFGRDLAGRLHSLAAAPEGLRSPAEAEALQTEVEALQTEVEALQTEAEARQTEAEALQSLPVVAHHSLVVVPVLAAGRSSVEAR